MATYEAWLIPMTRPTRVRRSLASMMLASEDCSDGWLAPGREHSYIPVRHMSAVIVHDSPIAATQLRFVHAPLSLGQRS
jgi:hypothetical protein